MHHRSGGVDPGRDGCRVPLPWTATGPSFGFSPVGTTATPWLPQPAEWARYAVDRQEGDPASTLTLYRRMLQLRRTEPEFGESDLEWLTSDELGGPDLIGFRRAGTLACIVNFGETAVPLPEHRSLLLASGPVAHSMLSPDSAVWLRL